MVTAKTLIVTAGKTTRELVCGSRRLNLGQPQVMGVLNITPDSFSDGGHLFGDHGPDLEAIRRRAARMCLEGAALLDVGGESTRPGAARVTDQQEIDRVAPVIDLLCREFDAVVSVDTSSPVMIREAARLGAGLINDVRALRRDGAVEAAADTGLPVCLMHMQGQPGTMQVSPVYGDVEQEVRDFLLDRAGECQRAGIAGSQLLFDPGFGFGKTLEHNLTLFARLEMLVECGFPVLIGVSRKSMIGALLERPVTDRLAGGVALAALAVKQGVAIVRSHDVAATLDAVRIGAAVANEETT